jgi:hypothetical protein
MIGYSQNDFKSRLESPKVMSPNPFEVTKEAELTPEFTNSTGEAQLLPWMDTWTDWGTQNSIDAKVLTQLLNFQKKSLNYLIIDCRSMAEFKGGHIKGAMNISSKEQLHDFFFGSEQRTAYLMKS